VVQHLGQYSEVSIHPRQEIVGNDCAPLYYLLVRVKECLAKDRFHVCRAGRRQARNRSRRPALREHKEDIPPIVDVMLQKLNKKYATRVTGVDAEVMDLLHR
jgi:hypothetical protein